MQNDGKEMYKKSVLHVQSCFLLIRPIVFFFFAIFVAVGAWLALHDFILIFVHLTIDFNENFAFSPG